MNQKDKWSDVIYLLCYKWRWIIIGSFIITLCISLILWKTKADEYSATTSLLIHTKKLDGKTISSALSIETYSEIAKSDIIMNTLQKEIREKYTSIGEIEFMSHLQHMKYGGGIAGLSPILKLEVRSERPDNLSDIVDAWGKEFLSYIGEFHYNMESDYTEYMQRKTVSLQGELDSTLAKLKDIHLESNLDYKSKELELLKKNMFLEMSKRQLLTREIAEKKIQFENIISLRKMVEDEDNESLRSVQRKYSELFGKNEKNDILLEQLSFSTKKLHENKMKLFTYSYKKEMLDNRKRILDSMVQIIPEKIEERSETESAAGYQSPVLVKTERANPLYVNYTKELTAAREELLSLENERKTALHICSKYEKSVDSLHRIQNVVGNDKDNLERKHNLTKDRENWRLSFSDSLTRQMDRLQADIASGNMMLPELDRSVDVVHKKVVDLGRSVESLLIKKDYLVEKRNRIKENYASIMKNLSEIQRSNSMGMANLRMLSKNNPVVKVEDDTVAKQAVLSLIAVFFVWIVLAMVAVKMKQEFESATDKNKVDKMVETMESSEVKK